MLLISHNRFTCIVTENITMKCMSFLISVLLYAINIYFSVGNDKAIIFNQYQQAGNCKNMYKKNTTKWQCIRHKDPYFNTLYFVQVVLKNNLQTILYVHLHNDLCLLVRDGENILQFLYCVELNQRQCIFIMPTGCIVFIYIAQCGGSNLNAIICNIAYLQSCHVLYFNTSCFL